MSEENRTIRNRLLRKQRLKAARLKGTHTKYQWLEMLNFFNYTCVRCEEKKGHLDKDHIVPIYQGGSDGIDNIQPICTNCNCSKGRENTDHRLSFCEKHNLIMPELWTTKEEVYAK